MKAAELCMLSGHHQLIEHRAAACMSNTSSYSKYYQVFNVRSEVRREADAPLASENNINSVSVGSVQVSDQTEQSRQRIIVQLASN